MINLPGNKYSSQHVPFPVHHRALILPWLAGDCSKEQEHLRTPLIYANNQTTSSTTASSVISLIQGLHNLEGRDPFVQQTQKVSAAFTFQSHMFLSLQLATLLWLGIVERCSLLQDHPDKRGFIPSKQTVIIWEPAKSLASLTIKPYSWPLGESSPKGKVPFHLRQIPGQKVGQEDRYTLQNILSKGTILALTHNTSRAAGDWFAKPGSHLSFHASVMSQQCDF